MKRILICVVGSILVVCCVFVFISSNSYRKMCIEKQLERKYGCSLSVDKIDAGDSKYSFVGYSDDGIFFMGECNWAGRLSRESYAHYYYSDNIIEDMAELFVEILQDFYIVRDCVEFGANKTVTNLLDVQMTKTYEEYKVI